MDMNGARKFKYLWSVIPATTLAFPIFAQNAEPDTTPATAAIPQQSASGNIQASGGVADIVVTAQKRAENVQNVPISVAAFGSKTLEQSHITTVADLPKLTPNFNVSRGQQVSSIGLRIRGVGAAGNTATEPSVATFVDGVYVPRPGALFASFLDVQGVEVLRGPQGTLFGRNASVGAVSLRTGVPGDKFAADLKAEAGTGDRYKLEGDVDLPITQDVALRVAGLAQWFNGFWHNDETDKSFGGQNNQAVRATLKVKPWSNVTWLVRGEYTHITGDGYPMEDLLPETVPAANRAVLQQRLGGVLPDFNPYNKSTDEYIDSRLVDKQWAVSSDLTVDTAGDFSLRLIDSYRNWNNHQRDADVTFMPIPIFARDAEFKSGSQSHELQIISPKDKLLGGKLDFVAGLYYFRERFEIGEKLSLFDNLCNLVGPLKAACLAGPLTNATDLSFNQVVNSYAAYGQATYKILPKLELTLGGRYTKDNKTGSFLQLAPNAAAARIIRAPENDQLKTDGGKFTYRINLSWHPAERVMLFANYSTGYKSGGFNSGGGATSCSVSRASSDPKTSRTTRRA
jgi:iron complex outermembrane receptor protein